MLISKEYLEIVNRNGKVIGIRPRAEIHGNPALIHRVVHVLVFNRKAELLLQKRSMNKDVAPGKWDTSVGGHVNPGEELLEAVNREMKEELGITICEPEFLYTYIHSNPYESEIVHTYSCIYDKEVSFNRDEIDEVKFWRLEEIEENIGKGIFSDNFEDEIGYYIRTARKGK